MERGAGSIEADFLNGEIALLGTLTGVPTPVNSLVQRLANRTAHERKPPGSTTPNDILTRITAAAGG
jgi:2-dehydropantoate 2-reductase